VTLSYVNVGHPSAGHITNETNDHRHIIALAAYITVVYFVPSLKQEGHKSTQAQCALKVCQHTKLAHVLMRLKNLVPLQQV